MQTRTQAQPVTTPDWHAMTISQACAELRTAETGLSAGEAERRLAESGLNRLRVERRESLLHEALEEVREPMILLLLATALAYGIVGGIMDALTIFAIIIVVVSVEIFNEQRAKAALASLRRLAEPVALVRRDGVSREVPFERLVPGDVLLLREGQRVPADARLIESYGLHADESPLTGESVPVEKLAMMTLPETTPLAERHNMVYAGSVITRGRGTAIIIATGMRTELGRIASLAAGMREPRTPLQQLMRELTRWLVWLALGFSILVPLLGWLLAGQPPQQMLLTALSLAFATIPEELPVLVTIVLAVGAYRLSRQHAIVKRLRAAETLSAVTVIATDKTGTLTENRMTVSEIAPEEQRARVLEIGALCNDAVAGDHTFVGDPLDVALLEAAQTSGMDTAEVRARYPVSDEFSFDGARKRMSVVYTRAGARWAAVKGAPESVLARSTHLRWGSQVAPLTSGERADLIAQAAEMSERGLRVIACAEKPLPEEGDGGSLLRENVESDLTFVGFAGLADPARPEARLAIAACRVAGIRLIMVTGDHPRTARAIAGEVGLDGAGALLTGPEIDTLSDDELRETVRRVALFARTTPEHKLRIVEALRTRGERVAVTGDGINDAPALAAADIGIAMGERGTDVAREAAGIVLADDNFATIALAVREGRLLFANLAKAIRFYLAVKVALIAVTLLPVLLLVPVPFSPVQIIITELFMDVATSATFTTERAEADLMRQPPRDPRQPFMNRRMVASIFLGAAGLFAAVTTVYLVNWYAGAGLPEARTAAFVTWLLGHVLLALNFRSEREPLLRLGIFSNRMMVAWVIATVVFVPLISFVPAVQRHLDTTALTPAQWGFTLFAAVLGTCWLEVAKLVASRRRM